MEAMATAFALVFRSSGEKSAPRIEGTRFTWVFLRPSASSCAFGFPWRRGRWSREANRSHCQETLARRLGVVSRLLRLLGCRGRPILSSFHLQLTLSTTQTFPQDSLWSRPWTPHKTATCTSLCTSKPWSCSFESDRSPSIWTVLSSECQPLEVFSAKDLQSKLQFQRLIRPAAWSWH